MCGCICCDMPLLFTLEYPSFQFWMSEWPRMPEEVYNNYNYIYNYINKINGQDSCSYKKRTFKHINNKSSCASSSTSLLVITVLLYIERQNSSLVCLWCCCFVTHSLEPDCCLFFCVYLEDHSSFYYLRFLDRIIECYSWWLVDFCPCFCVHCS